MEKLIKKDLFQNTQKIREPTAFGAFNSFFVMPIVCVSYIAVLVHFNTIQSTTKVIFTEACSPLNFTCTSNYGCEVAALGKRTISRFSKGNGSLLLEQGESFNEMICPGQSEALDIAPRMSISLGPPPQTSYVQNILYKGYLYLFFDNIMLHINLETMRVVKKTPFPFKGTLGTAFNLDNHGYFVTTVYGSNSNAIFVYKVDLNTMEIVRNITLDKTFNWGGGTVPPTVYL